VGLEGGTLRRWDRRRRGGGGSEGEADRLGRRGLTKVRQKQDVGVRRGIG
jgi:hypothetical protein